MKKIWIITLIIILIPVTSILVFIMVDHYTKYALKVATIKLVKEYCNEEITVKEVEITRFYLLTTETRWMVYTNPPKYTLSGPLTREGYQTNVPRICSTGPYIYLKLNRLKREFEMISR